MEFKMEKKIHLLLKLELERISWIFLKLVK